MPTHVSFGKRVINEEEEGVWWGEWTTTYTLGVSAALFYLSIVVRQRKTGRESMYASMVQKGTVVDLHSTRPLLEDNIAGRERVS